MLVKEPVADLGRDFSSPGAKPTPWAEAREILGKAEVCWLSTVRPDGRPHVTPLVAVWLDQAMYFCTGESERKNRNLEQNPHCILTAAATPSRTAMTWWSKAMPYL
jgi:nitroimidazol reductase NimA-like FMN-containing flavoprotein (pyridoxamine 5'-phosphate oxidase superfamily)